MGFSQIADGQTAGQDLFNLLMIQGVTTHATRAARTAAFAAAYPAGIPDGTIAWLIDEQVCEQYIAGAWQVKLALKNRAALSSAYTPPTTTDASLATTFHTFLLKAGCTYRIRGEWWVPAGSLKVNSNSSAVGTGALVGVWGTGTGANLFDKTSAASNFTLSTGRNAVGGELTVGPATTTWTINGYAQTASGTVDVGGFVEIERTA